MLNKLLSFFLMSSFAFITKSYAFNLPDNIDELYSAYDTGCFYIKEVGQDKALSWGECQTRYIPCSTYKIPNSMIALETKALKSKNEVIKWDGKKKFLKSWEKDHTLPTAIKHSVVPFYQEVARRIGLKRMSDYVKRLDYGNKDIGSKVDIFWLRGPLKISAQEQVQFIEKLYLNKLPFHQETMATVRDILVLEKKEKQIASGKTGSSMKNKKSVLGWFVGHIKTENNKKYVFAVNVVGKEKANGKYARNIALTVLTKMGIYK